MLPEPSENFRHKGITCLRRPSAQLQAMVRRAILLLTALSVLETCGCGGGTSFTGGSIPPGGTRLYGRVVQAEDPLTPLANTTISVTATPAYTNAGPIQLTTNSNGEFNFPTVRFGSTAATINVTVQPGDPTARQSQQVVFRSASGQTANLIVSLPQKSFDITQGTSVAIGSISEVAPQGTAAIQAHVLDSTGHALPVEPTLLFIGNFGTIDGDGTFTASASGTGTITVFWYNVTPVTTAVKADPSASLLPPPPPTITTGQTANTSGPNSHTVTSETKASKIH